MTEPEPPRKPVLLWAMRFKIALAVILPMATGYAGLLSLDDVSRQSSRTILGFLGLAGFFGLLWLGQFLTASERKELKDWAWQKQLYKIRLASSQRQRAKNEP